ncbi:MAG: hypothetical protein ACOC90_06740, partial [Bacteroidota bacterium]
ILVIAVYALLLVVVTSLVSGSIAGDRQLGLSQFSGIEVIMIYFLQTLAYMSMAMLFAILFKNHGLAIVLFILYLFPGEVILRNLIFQNIQEYFPAKLISGLAPLPSIFRDQADALKGMGMEFGSPQTEATALISPQQVVLTLLYIAVFLTITYWILRRKNY